MKRRDHSLPEVLPVGTAIVTRVAVIGSDAQVTRPKGSVGVVTRMPAGEGHHYRIRFPGGEEAVVPREDFAVLRHYQNEAIGGADASAAGDLYQFVIYRAVVGSRAYGLEHGESDYDRRGIYLPPAEMHWSLYGLPEQLENEATQETYWELEKFLTLALKANPNVLEVMYSPVIELAEPLAQELLAMRQRFLSKLVYQTYNGYVMSQFKKLEQDIRTRGAIKWKHAMHMVRLLLSGITILREARVPLEVGEHRPALVAIRDGQMSWEEVNAWRVELHGAFDAAFATTRLPDQPDYEAANRFLIRARRSLVR